MQVHRNDKAKQRNCAASMPRVGWGGGQMFKHLKSMYSNSYKAKSFRLRREGAHPPPAPIARGQQAAMRGYTMNFYYYTHKLMSPPLKIPAYAPELYGL